MAKEEGGRVMISVADKWLWYFKDELPLYF